jgi:hypothetical protein
MKSLNTTIRGMYENVEPQDDGEYNYEGDMAKNQLRTVVDAAQELITKSMDYIDTVRDYMKSKAQEEKENG